MSSLEHLGGAETPSRLRGSFATSEPVMRDELLDLARAAARGDVAATRRLLDEVAPTLLRVVRGVLGADHPEVDDVLQEALLGFLSSLAQFREECRVIHYANRIAARTAVSARRRIRDRQQREGDLGVTTHALQPEVPSPDAGVMAARRRELVRGLLDELPVAQAESFVLRVVLGLSLEEVAEATGAPLNTVRSRLRLAKEVLTKKIQASAVLAEVLEAAG